MPMILVKKNPRGKVIRELSSEEETAVKTVCGLKRPATMAQHNLANDLLREMREYDAWLQCDCIPGDSPAMNFAALKNNTGTLYLSSLNRPGFPGECFICELRLPDHRFRWKHNKLFLLLPEEYGPAFPAIVDCYTSPPT